MSFPSWHQWISYETKRLDRDALAKFILESIEYPIYEREKFGIYGKTEATARRFKVAAERIVIQEVDRILSLDETEQQTRLRSLRSAFDEYFSRKTPLSEDDPYSYRRRMKDASRLSIGLMEGGNIDHFAADIFLLRSARR